MDIFVRGDRARIAKLGGYLKGTAHVIDGPDESGGVTIVMPNGNESIYPHWLLLNVLCTNCKHTRSTHMNDGKCIYGPGYWEEQEP